MTFHPANPIVSGDPSNTTLTNNTNRTPSTTRPVFVTVVCDWNTIAAATGSTVGVTVGGTLFGTDAVFNTDAVTARRLGLSISFWVPANTAYKVNCSSMANLTITATEAVA